MAYSPRQARAPERSSAAPAGTRQTLLQVPRAAPGGQRCCRLGEQVEQSHQHGHDRNWERSKMLSDRCDNRIHASCAPQQRAKAGWYCRLPAVSRAHRARCREGGGRFLLTEGEMRACLVAPVAAQMPKVARKDLRPRARQSARGVGRQPRRQRTAVRAETHITNNPFITVFLL